MLMEAVKRLALIIAKCAAIVLCVQNVIGDIILLAVKYVTGVLITAKTARIMQHVMIVRKDTFIWLITRVVSVLKIV